MGFGIATYLHSQLPLILYVLCIFVLYGTFSKGRVIGYYYLLFLFPFTFTLIKMHKFPLGNQVMDALFLSLVVTTLLHCKKKIISRNSKPIILHIVIITVSFFYGYMSEGPLGMADIGHTGRMMLLKNYLTMPLLYWLTLGILQGENEDRRSINIVMFLLLVLLIVDWRFWNGFRFSSHAHFSEDARSHVFGSLGANHLAAFAVEYLAVAISLFLFYGNKKTKFFLVLVIAGGIYVVLFTYSRAAYVALAALFVFFFNFKKKLFVPIVIICLAVGGSVISFLPTSVVERVTMTKTEDGEIESSAAARIEIWNQGKAIFYENPIIGIGYHMVPSYINIHGLTNLHNYIFQVLVETGIIGFSVFFYLLYSAFITGWRLHKQASDSFSIALGLGFCGCVLASVICNFFGDRWSFVQMQAYWWVFWAVCDYRLEQTSNVNNLRMFPHKSVSKT